MVFSFKNEYFNKLEFGMLNINQIYNIDCLEGMKEIDDASIDMILCDLPYGTTACKWDTIIPFEPLWEQYERIIKDNGAIVLTASQPFTSQLVLSNINLYRQSLVYLKTRPTNVFNAKKQFMKWHEDIVVFYKHLPTFNPQMRTDGQFTGKKVQRNNHDRSEGIFGQTGEKKDYVHESNNGLFYPKTILEFSNVNKHANIHPTQKPIELFEYLIKTYTNEGDLVLDNCIGAGTTALACLNTNRNYIGMDNGICEKKNSKYYGWYWADVARDRINNHEHRKV
jgi:site-specific DNA-methyltransferase (adenine-specific)